MTDKTDRLQDREEELIYALEEERARSAQLHEAAIRAESNELQLYRQFFPALMARNQTLETEIQRVQEAREVPEDLRETNAYTPDESDAPKEQDKPNEPENGGEHGG